MVESRTWICPALCGCELHITANWSSVAEAGGRSYQHPAPGSLTTLAITAVCAVHDHFRTDPPIVDQTYGGEMAGYLLRSAVTETEKLYVALTRYTGQRLRPDTCRCRIYEHRDRTTSTSTQVAVPPKHTMKCVHHLLDDDQHTTAFENMRRKNQTLGRLREQIAALTDDDIAWAFDDGTRVLRVTARGLTPPQRNALQAWCNVTLGPGLVVIE